MINLNDLDEKEIYALAQVTLIANGKVLEVLEKLADNLKTQLVRADDMVRIHRLQGRVEQLEALGTAIRKAVKLQAS